MAIKKPTEMDFSNKHINMIITGMPNTGKTTLACSADSVVVFDLDSGMARINKEHRRDSSFCATYEELLADLKEAEGVYKTVVIDTCGALIEYIKDWAMRTEPKAKKQNGGFSLQGYGIVKTEYLRLSAELRKNFDTIFIFHETMEKNGDDGMFYQIVVEGSTRSLVFQPADLACHLFIDHGKRYAGFSPTEQYNAKSAYGIKGIIEIPELKDGDANNFISKLFAKARANLVAETKSLSGEQETYENAMKEAKDICKAVEKPEDVAEAAKAITSLEHALTSEKEAKAMLRKRMETLGIAWDKGKKAYVSVDKKAE